jgi:hypothetical protein
MAIRLMLDKFVSRRDAKNAEPFDYQNFTLQTIID